MKKKIVLFSFLLSFSFSLSAYSLEDNLCKKEFVNYFVSFDFIKNKLIDYNVLTIKNLSDNILNNLKNNQEKEKQINEMRNVAEYISTNYVIPFEDSEKIVYHVYSNSLKHNVEPHLVLGLISTESTFNYSAQNKSAKGLMQVIERFHPEEINMIKSKNLDIHSIEGNIEAGVMILKKYIEKQNGNVTRALQMYNGSLNDGNRKYSKKVLSTKNKFVNLFKTEKQQ